MQRLLSRKLLAFPPKERFNHVVSSYAKLLEGKKKYVKKIAVVRRGKAIIIGCESRGLFDCILLVDYIVRQTIILNCY